MVYIYVCVYIYMGHKRGKGWHVRKDASSKEGRTQNCKQQGRKDRTDLVVVDDGGLLADARRQLLLGQPCIASMAIYNYVKTGWGW